MSWNDLGLLGKLTGSLEFCGRGGRIELDGNGKIVLLRSQQPIGTWEERSAEFHFTPVGGEPMILAKNPEEAYRMSLVLLDFEPPSQRPESPPCAVAAQTDQPV